MKTYQQYLKRTRICMAVMIAGLALSGITAFPLEAELRWLCSHGQIFPPGVQQWFMIIYQALKDTNARYPYLCYGTDWLAFAHLMLAVLFVGAYLNPVKNRWVIQFGIIACVAIFALAFIAGPVRHIPWFWTLIDCSFGVFGLIPLLVADAYVRRMEVLGGPGLFAQAK